MKNRLKDFRKNLGLSQDEFAQRIGKVTRSHISNIENGANASDRVIEDICDTFNLNPDWLKYGVEPQFRTIHPDDELGELIGELIADNDDFKKRLILTLLKLDDNKLEVLKEIAIELAK